MKKLNVVYAGWGERSCQSKLECHGPLSRSTILPSAEMYYGRNSSAVGNETMCFLVKECKLARGWPPALFKGEQVSGATTHIILARETLVLIKKYLELKSKENPVVT